MKKSIAIVVCVVPPQGGGIGNNAYYHFKKLRSLGYNAELFTPKFKNIEESAEAGLKYLPVRFALGKAGFLFSLWKQLEKFDIFHLYYPFFGTDIIVWLYKVLHPKKKLVIHYQMDAIGQGWQKYFFKIYLKLFLPFIVRATDKVFILSEDNARHSYLKKFFKKWPDKFEVVPNAIDTDIFKPQKEDESLKEKYNIKPTDKIITFVGGLDDQHFFKGVDVLLRAFTRLHSNTKLFIIGDGNLKEKYKTQARDLRLKDRVIFTGWVKNEDLPQYYSISDIFVLPSTERTESFGIVTAEAQACGVPAVVSNWPGSRQTLEEGKTGFLVEPKSVDDLKDKLEILLGDEDQWQMMSRAGAKRSKEMYDWERVIKKIEEIYNNI